MLDLNDAGDLKAYEELKKAGLSMDGINFALAMRKDNGSVKVYRRENQPCQGGEMRKYEKTHPGDCTRPKDARPGDLRNPFPLGTPEAVAVHFNLNRESVYPKLGPKPEWAEFLKALYGWNSPYLSGFGSPEDVEFLYEDDTPHGIIFKNTEVDPTVLVNSLQFLNTMKTNYVAYRLYREGGFSEAESLCIMMLMNSNPSQGFITETYDYYFPVQASIRRIIEGRPHDLTGGTLRDRFDYNRPQVQSLFRAGEGEVRTAFRQALKAEGLVTEKTVEKKYKDKIYSTVENTKVSISDYFAAARIVIDKAMEGAKDEDYSIVTLKNENFGKSDKKTTFIDYGEDVDYDFDEDDGGPEETYGDPNEGTWFQIGCGCESCLAGLKKYNAKMAAKKPHKVSAVETNTLILDPTITTYQKTNVEKSASLDPTKTYVVSLKAAPKSPKPWGKAKKGKKVA